MHTKNIDKQNVHTHAQRERERVLVMILIYGTAAPNLAKSGQKIWQEPDLAGFAKKGGMPDLPELEPKDGTSLEMTGCLNNYHAHSCHCCKWL